MESKQSNRHPRTVDGVYRPAKSPPKPTPVQSKPAPAVDLFNDEIEKDENLDDFHFKDILNAWFRQAIHNSPLEKHLKKAHRKKRQLAAKKNAVKNDLKWALMADLDVPVTKRTSIPTRRPAPQRNAVAPTLSGKWRVIAAVAIAGLLLFLAIPKQPQSASSHNSSPSASASKPQTSQTPQNSTQPQGVAVEGSPPLLPKGKSVAGMTNFYQSKTSDGLLVYGFSDIISGITIRVNEQQIAESNKSNLDAYVGGIAKQYSANEAVAASSTKVYIASPQGNSQSVIFAKNGWLMIIGSPSNIGSSAWVSYADSLQ